MARDKFTKDVINSLRNRVANRCSNPKCRVPTTGPAGKYKINNIGIAAHITAASPKGPRYDPSISSIDRSSFDNGIWLCANCSVDIDKDTEKYTVTLLKEWKYESERFARQELGKKLPDNNETIDTVAEALTGFPKRYISTAIKNVHQASNISLEGLDPRFEVSSTFMRGLTSFELIAKEPVLLSIDVNKESISKFIEKRKKLIEQGEDISFKSEELSLKGSRLIDELFGNLSGTIKISPKKVKATQKLWLVEDGTNSREIFDDIHGDISFGTKALTFNGYACNGLFNFKYSRTFEKDSNNTKLSILLDYSQWEGKRVNDLSYFEKLYDFFIKIEDGWTLFTSLEYNGLRILSSEGLNVSKWENALNINNLLHYTHCCRLIASHFNKEIKFKANVSCTPDEYDLVSSTADIVSGIYSFSDISMIKENLITKMIVDESLQNLALLEGLTSPTSFKMIQRKKETLNLFNTPLELPDQVILVENVLPQIDIAIDKIQPNESLRIEWLPQKEFKIHVGFE